MLLEAGKPPPRHWMEAVSLHTSRETWLAIRDGDSGAWLTPTQNGRVRVKKPPMLVWLNLLSWSDLESDADPQKLIARGKRIRGRKKA